MATHTPARPLLPAPGDGKACCPGAEAGMSRTDSGQPLFLQDDCPLPTPRGLRRPGPRPGGRLWLHLLSSPEDLGGDDEAGSSVEQEKGGCYWV